MQEVNKPNKDLDLANILSSDSVAEAPDIVIVGFQEIVSLSWYNLFNKVKGK